MIVKEDSTQGRQLKFLDNDQNLDFKCKMQNMINYKMFMEACFRKGQKLDPFIIAYFQDSNLTRLSFQDKYLNEEHKILHIFDSMVAHQRLT